MFYHGDHPSPRGGAWGGLSPQRKKKKISVFSVDSVVKKLVTDDEYKTTSTRIL